MKSGRRKYVNSILQVDPKVRIGFPVFSYLYLYLIFCFIKAIIYILRHFSFSYLDIFMHCIYLCFTSIYALHLITYFTQLYVSCVIHKLLIYLIDICIDTTILSLLQVIYQLHGIMPLLCFCFSPHVLIPRYYVLCLIFSHIYISHIWPHAS